MGRMIETEITFKPGDKIKLKNYFPCGDWKAHEGEKATIIKRVQTYSENDYDWEDVWQFKNFLFVQ